MDPSTLTFFPVATHKFAVMSFFTFGLYELYWCYKSWARIEARTGRGRSPLLRAIFAPISSFWLFPEIHRTLERESVPASWHPALLATLYFALSLAGRLPNGWWALSLLSFTAFLPALSSIQTLHMRESDGAVPNSRYSAANICAIAFGTLLFLIILVGALVPDTQRQ